MESQACSYTTAGTVPPSQQGRVEPPPAAPAPRRVIGGAGGLAIVAGSMLGIGIFLFPRIVAANVPSVWMFFFIWLLGGFNALCGAAAYSEMGGMYPRSGGDYVFLQKAFGPSIMLPAGLLLFFGVFAGSIASMAVPIFQFQVPALLSPWVVIEPGASVPLISSLLPGVLLKDVLAVGLVLLFTIINLFGARLSSRVQMVVTLVPLILLALGSVYIFFTFESLGGSAATTATTATTVPLSMASLTTAFLAVYFAYAGWNAVGYVGGEMVRPSRTIPLSLIGGTLVVTLLYLLLTGSFFHVLGLDGLRGAFEAGTAVAGVVGGSRWQFLVTSLITLALLGSINGTILAGARIGHAMAADRVLPHRPFVRLARSGGAPYAALWLQAAAAIILILSGTFERLVEFTSIAMLVMGSLVVLSLYLLRHRHPDHPRPYRALGYPVLPALYLVVSAVVIVVSMQRAGRAVWDWLYHHASAVGVTLTTTPDSTSPPGPMPGEVVNAVYRLSGLLLFLLAWAVMGVVLRKRRQHTPTDTPEVDKSALPGATDTPDPGSNPGSGADEEGSPDNE